MVALGGGLCLGENRRRGALLPGPGDLCPGLLAAVFSIAVTLANYHLFQPLFSLLVLLELGLCLLGGWVVGFHILLFAGRALPLSENVSPEKRTRPGGFFLLCFLSVAVIDLTYLFFAAWPGILTADTIDQLLQIDSGNYNNINPFWHTQLMRLFIQPVQRLTGSYQTGVGVFSVFQILLMSAAFAYVLMTLYQRQFPKLCLISAWAFYALVHYNISYSVTLWKDIPFSLACLVITVALYRILTDMGKHQKADRFLFFLSGLALCVVRTNGILTYGILLLAVCLVPSLRKFRLIPWMAGILILGILLQGPVLTVMNVSGGDYVETMSIPLQQVARVVYEGRELDDAERELVETVADMETIRQVYSSEISDPMKGLVRQSPANAAIQKDPSAYFRLWLRLGLQYPGDYLKAWVDQTKGYWNGGYLYWVVAGQNVFENDLGIEATSGNNIIGKLFDLYIRYSQLASFLLPLISIGLFTWLMVLCCCLLRKRKHPAWILTLPSFSILVGLLIGTPVFSEFRYAYPMIISCPLVLCVTIFDGHAKEP